jgi:hypothetical protein
MNKYTVEYTVQNPAVSEGRKTTIAVGVIAFVITILSIIL